MRENKGSQWRRHQECLVHQLDQAEQGGHDEGKPEHQVDLLVDHIDGEGADARSLGVRSTDPKNLHLTGYHTWKHLHGYTRLGIVEAKEKDMTSPQPELDEVQNS